MDGSKFKSHEGDTATIEVDEDKDEKYRNATSRDFERRGGFNAGRQRRDNYRRDDRSPPRRMRSRSRDRSRERRDRDRSRSPGYKKVNKSNNDKDGDFKTIVNDNKDD